MVYYMGSKARFANDILAVTLAKRKPGSTYVEPFVGGGSILCRVSQEQGPRIGADLNEYMVAYLKALSEGWEPPDLINESQYTKIRKNPQKYTKELVGYVATGCSFGSSWFGSYARLGQDAQARNPEAHYQHNSKKSALEDAPGLKGATFVHSSYDKLEIPPSSLIYCDPPYVNTAGYVGEHQQHWRAMKFWIWADRQVDAGHTVFVSEYTGPSPEAYPLALVTDEHRAAMLAYRTLQNGMATEAAAKKEEYHRPPELVAKMDELTYKIKAFEEDRIKPARAAAARWKVVWEKEVVVNFSSDIGEGEGKKVTEKLFHREA